MVVVVVLACRTSGPVFTGPFPYRKPYLLRTDGGETHQGARILTAMPYSVISNMRTIRRTETGSILFTGKAMVTGVEVEEDGGSR